MLAERTNLLPA